MCARSSTSNSKTPSCGIPPSRSGEASAMLARVLVPSVGKTCDEDRRVRAVTGALTVALGCAARGRFSGTVAAFAAGDASAPGSQSPFCADPSLRLAPGSSTARACGPGVSASIDIEEAPCPHTLLPLPSFSTASRSRGRTAHPRCRTSPARSARRARASSARTRPVGHHPSHQLDCRFALTQTPIAHPG